MERSRDKVKAYLDENPNAIYLGSKILSKRLGLSAESIKNALNHPELADHKVKRPSNTPTLWDKPRAFTYYDRTEYNRQIRKQKLAKKFEYFEHQTCTTPLGEITVFGTENYFAVDVLKNGGLIDAHQNNLHLLNKFKTVTTQDSDGVYVTSTRDNQHFCSTRGSNRSLFKQYLKFKQEQTN